jgi:hypothetical protein
LKKNISIILLFLLGIGVKVLLKKDINIVNFREEIKEHSGSREYWGQRIGTFDSDDRFIKSIKKARKQISRMPKRRSLGLD